MYIRNITLLIASYGWIKKGQTKQLKTNKWKTKNKRTNVNGALHIATKELTYLTDKQINSQFTIALLGKLVKKQEKGILYVILDNAKYYHSKIVKEFLERQPRIPLNFLLSYSPNLNIIERLWKILKTQVTYNKFYQKFDDLEKLVIQFLNNQSWMENEPQNVLNDEFQIIKPNFSDAV